MVKDVNSSYFVVFVLVMLEICFCAIIQVAFLKEVGQKLSEVSPRGLNGTFFLFYLLSLSTAASSFRIKIRHGTVCCCKQGSDYWQVHFQ